MSRGPYPGWSLVEDGYLDEPEPDPEPPRRFGCLSFAVLLLVLVAGVPAPQGAPRVIPVADHLDAQASRPHADWMNGNLAALPGASERATSRSVVADAPPSGAIGTVLLGGYATWYATPGYTAAAGPVLRDVLGDWRGQWITVESGDRSVTLQLTDWCACGERHGLPTLLDLSDAAFSELGELSAGVIRVSIEIDPAEHPDDRRMRLEDFELPRTDTR